VDITVTPPLLGIVEIVGKALLFESAMTLPLFELVICELVTSFVAFS